MKTYSLKKTFTAAAGAVATSFRFLLRGKKNGAFKGYAKVFYRHLCDGFLGFRQEIEDAQKSLPSPKTIKPLEEIAKGSYFYSILIPVFHPKPEFLKMAIESALLQRVEKKEILIGFDGPQDDEVYKIVESLMKIYPGRIKSYQIDRESYGGGISSTTNFLQEKASGDFLLLMDHDDWMHPDLLYHYDASLSKEKDPYAVALYCDEYKMDENSDPIARTGFEKPQQPSFPFVFVNFICHCLLLSKKKWKEIGGLRKLLDGSQDYDLCLRMDLKGVVFHRIPKYLYAWRIHRGSSASDLSQKPYAAKAGQAALSEYAEKKALPWDILPGFFPTLYRARPKEEKRLKIRAIISGISDGKTLERCFKSLKNQVNVEVKISLLGPCEGIIPGADVFNGLPSTPLAALRNQAIHADTETDAYLFLDASIQLAPDSLKEMGFWLKQRDIGAVGCRLETPTDAHFSGGLFIKKASGQSFLNQKPLMWRDGASTWEWTLATADAVYMGCCLTSRRAIDAIELLDPAHPFQEIELARKLRKKGLFCFYTPFASGKAERDLSRDLIYVKSGA